MKMKTRDGFEIEVGHDSKKGFMVRVSDDDPLYLNESDFNRLADLVGEALVKVKPS